MEVRSTENTIFLIINCLLLAVGNCGGPLIMRLYFLRGGNRIWFSAFLETAGWPITLLPLLISYTRRRKSTQSTPLFHLTPRLFLAAAVIGLLTGLDDYLYASGMSKLPVSTSALLVATQLSFTAAFAFVLVRQRFTAYSVNAVVLLTVAAVVLGMSSGGDRPVGETDGEYWRGFGMTLCGAALYGLILPLVEMTYKKVEGMRYAVVMEIQMVMCFFATVFCTVGMLVNNDFQGIMREAKEYELGVAKYYLVVVWSAILWQCFYLGAIGVIFYASSLLAAIIIHVLFPLTETLAIIFYHESFHAEKGVSFFLAIWGFLFYFYGELKNRKKKYPSIDQTVGTQVVSRDSIP